MKNTVLFQVHKEDNTYIAEGVNFGIVTQANNLDGLVKNIEEAVSLHFNEEKTTNKASFKPSILVNYEILQYAKTEIT